MHTEKSGRIQIFIQTLFLAGTIFHFFSLSSFGCTKKSPQEHFVDAVRYALDKGKVKYVRKVLEDPESRAMIDIEAQLGAWSKGSGTPLYLATINANLKLVKLLLKHGADVDGYWYAKTPLENIAEELRLHPEKGPQYEEIISALKEHQRVRSGAMRDELGRFLGRDIPGVVMNFGNL